MRAGLQTCEPIIMRSGLEKSIFIFYAGRTNQNRSLLAKCRMGQPALSFLDKKKRGLS